MHSVLLTTSLLLVARAQAAAGRDAGGEEVSGELDMVDVETVVAQYERGSGGASSDINDAAWWEAAVREFEAFGGDLGGEDGVGLEEGEEEGEEVSSRKRGGWGRKERVVVTATVEDILRRPRMDTTFWELDEALMSEEEEEDDEDVEDVGAEHSLKQQSEAAVGVRMDAKPPLVKNSEDVDDVVEVAVEPRVQTSRVAQRRRGLGGRRGLLGRHRMSSVQRDE